jgi:RHS repeat-associated protein
VFHVVGSDEAVADVSYTESAQPGVPGTTTVVYPLTDALGSTEAVADAQGSVAEHDYFDSWGQRSNPDGSPLAKPTLFQSLVSGGFTGQERDDNLALVNMQGRLYDPALGRFLSADPIVGSPTFSQSWNAYSYVLNSPLNFTDPSGFDCTAGMAVATGTEKGFIANGQCSGSSNVTLPNGDEASVGDASRVPDAGPMISSTLAFMHDQQRMADMEQKASQHPKSNLPTKAADGTPVVLPFRYNENNALVDARGRRIYGPVDANPPLNYTSSPLAKYVGKFATRLFCGSKCAQASAPTSKREAAAAPKQLSDARIARNAVSQALAARALVKFIGKIGVVIDDGVDGVIARLMPDGMGMNDDEKKVMQMLAEKGAERARLIEEAKQRYDELAARYEAATAERDRLLDLATAAAGDMDMVVGPAVENDLIEGVYSDAITRFEKAQTEVERTATRLQFAHDWLDALRGGDK